MPWNGDQFEYTHAYIQAVIENYYLLLEEAKHNPHGNAAVLCYDIAIALASTRFTKKQWQALELRMQGFTEMEIAAVMRKADHSAVCRLLQRGVKKVTEKCHKNPVSRPNNYDEEG